MRDETLGRARYPIPTPETLDTSPPETAAIKSKPRRQTIGLLEHCGTGNLGDDATVSAVLSELRERCPQASLVVLSLDPADSRDRHGVESYPIRRISADARAYWSSKNNTQTTARPDDFANRAIRPFRAIGRLIKRYLISLPTNLTRELLFLIKCLLIVENLDTLIICGGGQLLDAWGGPWQFPYTIAKWVGLSKVLGVKCIFLNVGAGPLDSKLGRWFIERSLRSAQYISTRDQGSRALLKSKLSFPQDVFVVSDNAYSLRVAPIVKAKAEPEKNNIYTIAIAPMAYRDPSRYWGKDSSIYCHYLNCLTDFSADLVSRGHKLRIVTSDIWFDAQSVKDYSASLEARLGSEEYARMVRCEPIHSIDDYLEELSKVDACVTSKFHGVIFSHLAEKPVLALSYHPKVRTLMNEFDCMEYCIDLENVDASDIGATMSRLLDNMDVVKEKIASKVQENRSALAVQFDQLFGRSHLDQVRQRAARSPTFD